MRILMTLVGVVLIGAACAHFGGCVGSGSSEKTVQQDVADTAETVKQDVADTAETVQPDVTDTAETVQQDAQTGER